MEYYVVKILKERNFLFIIYYYNLFFRYWFGYLRQVQNYGKFHIFVRIQNDTKKKIGNRFYINHTTSLNSALNSISTLQYSLSFLHHGFGLKFWVNINVNSSYY